MRGLTDSAQTKMSSFQGRTVCADGSVSAENLPWLSELTGVGQVIAVIHKGSSDPGNNRSAGSDCCIPFYCEYVTYSPMEKRTGPVLCVMKFCKLQFWLGKKNGITIRVMVKRN